MRFLPTGQVKAWFLALGFLRLCGSCCSIAPVVRFSAAAVRLLRVEQGGAFADLLNEKGSRSGENSMSYVERTLGFRTQSLDDRDIRLVSSVFSILLLASNFSSPPAFIG